MILITGATSGPRSLAQRIVAGMWALAALGVVVLVLALGLALALLLVPVLMIAALVIWVRLRFPPSTGRRNVRVLRR